MAINPKVDIVYNMVPKNRETEIREGARRWNSVALREEYWNVDTSEWLPIIEDRPGLTMWTTSTSVGVTTYTLSGDALPSSDSSMYLVYYGAGKLSYNDYSIDVSAGTITLANSPEVVQELSIYYVGKSVVGSSPTGDIEVGEGLRVTVTETGLKYSVAPASASTIGGFKVGEGLTIDGEGVLSAAVTDIPVATATKVGGIKVGNTLSIDDDGILDIVTQDGDALQEWSTTTVVGTSTYAVGLDLPSGDSASYVVTYGGGILSPSNYSIDASANTITLSEAPTEATLLRVMFFKNLRVGYAVAEANLSDSVDSTSSTTAATSYAVKTAYDKATSATSAATTAQTTANSAVDKADAAQSSADAAQATADAAQSSADACLPLSGGRMTGLITFNSLIGGLLTNESGVANAPRIELYDVTRPTNGGAVVISATDGTTAKQLFIKFNGELTWDGKNIVRSVNGVNADTAGNVSLPLRGIEMVGHSPIKLPEDDLPLAWANLGAGVWWVEPGTPVGLSDKIGFLVNYVTTGKIVFQDFLSYYDNQVLRRVSNIPTRDNTWKTSWRQLLTSPSYSGGVEMTLNSSAETTYTCPSDGFIVINTSGFYGNYAYLYINDVLMCNMSGNTDYYSAPISGCWPVRKGAIVRAKSGFTSSFAGTHKLTFYPMAQ